VIKTECTEWKELKIKDGEGLARGIAATKRKTIRH
jgi:hypothetical protein